MSNSVMTIIASNYDKGYDKIVVNFECDLSCTKFRKMPNRSCNIEIQDNWYKYVSGCAAMDFAKRFGYFLYLRNDHNNREKITLCFPTEYSTGSAAAVLPPYQPEQFKRKIMERCIDCQSKLVK